MCINFFFTFETALKIVGVRLHEPKDQPTTTIITRGDPADSISFEKRTCQTIENNKFLEEWIEKSQDLCFTETSIFLIEFCIYSWLVRLMMVSVNK